MNSIKSIVVIPVSPKTKSYLFSKHRDLVIDGRYLNLKINKSIYGIPLIFKMLAIPKLQRYAPNQKNPSKEYLEIILPNKYAQFGFSIEDAQTIGRIIDELVTSELMFFIQNIASLPLMNRALSVRLALEFFGISEDQYDSSHFRRNIDRYSHKVLGLIFSAYRSKISAFIVKFYLENIERYSGNPELLKTRIENLKEKISNESSQFNGR